MGVSGNEIVGYYVDAASQEHGFLYDGSTFTTIDAPLADRGTYLTGVSGNEIVGYYYDDVSGGPHAFIATVPEPPTLTTFTVGALLLIALFRKS